MSKARLCVASLFAMCVVGVAVSSASAAFALSSEKCGSGKPSFCWDESATGTNLRELVGEEPEITLKQNKTQEALLEAVAGETVHIVCAETKAKEGVVHQTEPLVKESFATGFVVFEGCALLEPLGAKCKVPATITTKALMVAPGAVLSEVIFKPKEGEIFAEIAFSGEKCPATIKGTQPVKGKQKCEWKSTALAKTHELECATTGSQLTFFAGVAATFLDLIEVDLPNLGTTDFWDVELA